MSNIANKKGHLDTGKAKQNRIESEQNGIPKSKLGPSGLPKIHNVKKATLKESKEAARHQPGSNTAPVKHSSDKGKKTHFHSTRNGEKMHGGKNVHYTVESTKNNPE